MADPVNYCSWFASSFCVTQSEWAAWTQAVMSVLAIMGAAKIASSTERRGIARKTIVVVELLSLADHYCFVASSIFAGKYKLLGAAETTEESMERVKHEIQQVEVGLSNVQLHELPDHRLLYLVSSSRRECLNLLRTLDDSLTGDLEPLQRYHAIELIGSRLSRFHDKARDVSNQYTPWSIRKSIDRLQRVVFKLRHRRYAAFKKS